MNSIYLQQQQALEPQSLQQSLEQEVQLLLLDLLFLSALSLPAYKVAPVSISITAVPKKVFFIFSDFNCLRITRNCLF
jgi:hypothetical protein